MGNSYLNPKNMGPSYLECQKLRHSYLEPENSASQLLINLEPKNLIRTN